MAETNFCTMHIEDATEGVFLVGLELDQFVPLCSTLEGTYGTVDFLVGKLMKIMSKVDKTKFKKRAMLLYVKDLKTTHKW